METFIQVIIGGLLIGGVYALISLGLTLIFGVVHIVNFAHGEFLMLSMYTSYWLFHLLGIDPYLSILVIAPTFFLVGVVVQRGIFQPILEAPEVSRVFASLGLSILLQNLALFFWTADYRTVKTPYSALSLKAGDFMISFPRLVAFLTAAGITVGLYYFLKRTYT